MEKETLKNKYKFLTLLIVGVIFIFIGILKKENADVFAKATHICLECIGIG